MSIKLEHITYTYSPGTVYEMHALKDVDMEIPDGQFMGIIGHTGSGKSTLIQHFNGLMKPTSGTVFYNGQDIWADKYDRQEQRSKVGWYSSTRNISFLRQRFWRMSALGQRIWGSQKKKQRRGQSER